MNWFLLHFIHVLIKILIQEQIKIELSGPVVKIIETRQEINEEPRNTMRWVKSLLSKHKKSFGFIVMLSAVVTGSIWYSLWLSQSLSFVCESFSNHHYIREVAREYKTVRRDLMESQAWYNNTTRENKYESIQALLISLPSFAVAVLQYKENNHCWTKCKE